MLGEGVAGGHDGKCGLLCAHVGEALALANRGGEASVLEVDEARLVVEGLNLGRAAGLEEVDHPASLRREMRNAVQSTHARWLRCSLPGQHRGQCRRADAFCLSAEKVTAREESQMIPLWLVHSWLLLGYRFVEVQQNAC